MNICYFLFFSFLLLKGNNQVFAVDDSVEAPGVRTPLLSGCQTLASGGSVQESDSAEGQASARPVHSEVRTSRPLSSSVIPSSTDLLRKIDVAPAELGLAHVSHYICVIAGKNLELEQQDRVLNKEERITVKIKQAIARRYPCTNDRDLEIHLLALARTAISEDAPLKRLVREIVGSIEGLQILNRQLIGQNQELERILAEVEQQLRESRSTSIPISAAQTTDIPDQQRRIETLVRSNRCKCYTIGGLSTALGLSLIYGTWSLIHILH